MGRLGRWAASVLCCTVLAACGNGPDNGGQGSALGKLLAQTTATSDTAWRQCALEDQACTFAGTRAVRYGANGVYTVKTVAGPVQCDNATFGDPVAGVDKFCSLAIDTPLPAAWTACALEDGTCTVPDTRLVRYGIDGSFAYRTATGAIPCTNAVFDDPLPGVDKACSYAATVTQPGGDWTIVDLGTLGGDETVVNGLNDAGSVIGWSRRADGSQRAFLYRNGRMRDLGVLAGDAGSTAVAINKAGSIVGNSTSATGARPFAVESGRMREIALPFSAVNEVQDINDAGDILVFYYGTSHAGCTSPIAGCNYVFRKNGAALDLEGKISRGRQINNAGVIMAFTGNSREPAILYNIADDSRVTISTIPGGPDFPYYMAPIDMNNSQDLVGQSGSGRPFVYRGGVVADIDTVISGDVTGLNGINDPGDIVGSLNANGSATVFLRKAAGGSLVDLNDLAAVKAAQWKLEDVKAVNNAGQIIGHGTRADGKRRAFLLTPRQQ
jgi:probable HAF family extracellular repeat protein